MKLNLTSLEDKKAWEGYKLFNYNHKKIEENTRKSLCNRTQFEENASFRVNKR